MNRFISSTIQDRPLFTGRQIALFYWTLLFSFLLLTTSDLIAATDTKTSPQLAALAKETEVFEYLLEDRADPFVPFITEKAATATIDMNEIIEKDFALTGMQLFEPGQLTLVALLRHGPNSFAMVQDFTGKGYIINEGTKIGRKGVVKDIASNTVIIEETAETRAGKKIITEIVMLLKKEGEE